MLSASYVCMRNGMCFDSHLIIVSGSGTLADHVAHIKREFASMNPIISDDSTVEIDSLSMAGVFARLSIVPMASEKIIFLSA